MEIFTFGSSASESALSVLTEAQINELPYGVVRLDLEGRVLQYNATEGLITDRNPDAMLGLHFFSEVAPCTQGSHFHQRFYEALEQGAVNVIFEYIFDHQMQPTKVKVHLIRRVEEPSVWVVVKRL